MTHDNIDILVVDDDISHCTILQALLRGWGYNVALANSGRQALEQVREQVFDLVLCDVRMAEMDGIATLKEIKALNPAIPVLIMTAYSSVETAVEALKNGDDDVAEMREQYNQRRRYLLHAFAEMGLPCFEPYGAFYVFPCIREFGMTSDEFATRFLQEEKVAVVPGTAFGDSGEGYIRISYAYSLGNLKVAIGRLSHFVKKLKAEKE